MQKRKIDCHHSRLIWISRVQSAVRYAKKNLRLQPLSTHMDFERPTATKISAVQKVFAMNIFFLKNNKKVKEPLRPRILGPKSGTPKSEKTIRIRDFKARSNPAYSVTRNPDLNPTSVA